MLTRDQLLIDLLAAHANFTSGQLASLRDWWLSTRTDDEDLVAFLARHQVFSAPTVRVLRVVEERTLPPGLGANLIVPEDLDALRKRLPEPPKEGENLNATIHLMDGRDTDEANRSPNEEGPPRVGHSLGKYLLTEWVSEGSCGIVFRGLHPTLQIPVAVKVLRATTDDTGELLRRLKSEGQVLARLNHPNIVRVLDFEPHPFYPFLVLEYVNGPSLAELIRHSGRLRADRAQKLLCQIVSALAEAHRMGIVHRDIKPANILLTRDGEAKLADLGLALVLSGPDGGSGIIPASARVGTICYMAPELALGVATADQRSDIYSLGATFFHAMTGVPPFAGDSARIILQKQTEEPPPAPRDLAADVPPALSELIRRMLAKNPEDRPASYADILSDPAIGTPGSNDPHPTPRPGKRSLIVRLFRRSGTD